ncbi:MAG: 50S ribosomal protein L10 [Methanomassiliicoccales archaeon]
MAHVASWKKDLVKELADTMVNSNVVAVVDLRGIPSAQLQMMRQGLRAHASLVMTRNTLMQLAITDAAKRRPGLESLLADLGGQCAIVSTDMNPFKLFRQMEATKSPSAAKAGDLAPEDIVIKAGDTPFKPGPIVGELQKVGIPAGIEGGKIVIKKDKLLVAKGMPFSEELCKVLPKLEILPMTVGMDLRAAFENGIVYKKDVLDVPEDYYTSMLGLGFQSALGLSMTIAYVAPETIVPLMSKAYREASALSMEIAYPTKDNISQLLAKADAQMRVLSDKVKL